MENLQPSGSFKSRGIGYYMLARLRERSSASNIHFFASSGGNAGLACVHAARALGYPATIVVPMTTTPLMIAKLKTAGAHEVVQIGASWADADRFMREELLAKNDNGIYVPPFDHPDIWTGNSTIVPELESQMHTPPDALICSVGGGGLLNGIMQGLDALSWTRNTTVVAVETAGAESLHESVKSESLITLPGITSKATSLGCVRVASKSLEWALQEKDCIRSVVLPDAEAAMGCWRLADDERMVVELACGVNVALCYDGRLERVLGGKLRAESRVVIVLCGGSNVNLDMLEGWKREFGWVEKKVKGRLDADVPSSYTAP